MCVHRFEKRTRVNGRSEPGLALEPACGDGPISQGARYLPGTVPGTEPGARAHGYTEEAGRVRILTLPLHCWVTLGKLLNLSEPQFLHQENGSNNDGYPRQ